MAVTRTSNSRLFSGINVGDRIGIQTAALAKEIRDLESNYLLNVSEEDLVKWLVDKHRIRLPMIRNEEIHVADQGETNRIFSDFGVPVIVPGTTVSIGVPFDGDAALFQVKPNTFLSSGGPSAEIIGSEIRLTYETDTLGEGAGKAIKTQYQSALREIEQYLGWLRPTIDSFNTQLETSARDQISDRKKRILGASGMVASLGLPIKRREGSPVSYSVPLTRRAPRIERPQASGGTFQPEPTWALEEYDHALSILRNMVRAMELSPSAFGALGEEEIRNFFLVYLNGEYKGQATAEAFNFQGKTDILLGFEGRNAFIAECKFWKGEKGLLEAIDQLLSYLSWRDTKTAILLFNRNLNFSRVLEKIVPTVRSHQCFKRDQKQISETEFSPSSSRRRGMRGDRTFFGGL